MTNYPSTSSEKLIAIANFWIVKNNIEKERLPELTIMKLIKLTYIAQGYMLAIYGSSLFEESIKAWKYGPVIAELYFDLKRISSDPIKSVLYTINLDEEDNMLHAPITFNFSSKEKTILSVVWGKYKTKDGIQLSALTHQKDTPWDKTKNHEEIKPQIIQEYYRDLFNQTQI